MTELYDYFYENIVKYIKVTIKHHKHHKHHIHHTCHNHYPCPCHHNHYIPLYIKLTCYIWWTFCNKDVKTAFYDPK